MLGRRWTLRILWELRDGPHTFRALRERCDGASPSVLNERLKTLRDYGLVEREARAGYALTAAGETLGEQLLELNAWAERWASAADGSA